VILARFNLSTIFVATRGSKMQIKYDLSRRIITLLRFTEPFNFSFFIIGVSMLQRAKRRAQLLFNLLQLCHVLLTIPDSVAWHRFHDHLCAPLLYLIKQHKGQVRRSDLCAFITSLPTQRWELRGPAHIPLFSQVKSPRQRGCRGPGRARPALIRKGLCSRKSLRFENATMS